MGGAESIKSLFQWHWVRDARKNGYRVWYPGPWFNIKLSSYQYRKSHCGDKTVVRSSYLHNGISYTGKMSSLYWIRALISGDKWWCEYGLHLILHWLWIFNRKNIWFCGVGFANNFDMTRPEPYELAVLGNTKYPNNDFSNWAWFLVLKPMGSSLNDNVTFSFLETSMLSYLCLWKVCQYGSWFPFRVFGLTNMAYLITKNT